MAQGRKQRVTLRQIAEETGYAVITVSKALRGERDIAEAIKRLGGDFRSIAEGLV